MGDSTFIFLLLNMHLILNEYKRVYSSYNNKDEFEVVTNTFSENVLNFLK